MTTRPTLPEFLLARIAENEAVALDAAGWDRSGRERATGRWSRVGIASIEDDAQRSVIYSDNDQLTGTVADHIARHDPARVLAECEVNRRIVEEHRSDVGSDPCDAHNASFETVPCDTLRFLALPYADHPDYRDEWRP